ncbi:MAG: ankyrin repeat domain-containing protein, partial [Blastocatellia bacterium]
ARTQTLARFGCLAGDPFDRPLGRNPAHFLAAAPWLLLALVVAATSIVACGGDGSVAGFGRNQAHISAAEARDKLDKRGIKYSAETFLESAKKGDIDFVGLFLAAGMDPDVRNKSGQTALMAAARKGQCAAIEMLLDRGASVNLKDSEGVMALHYAAGAPDDFKCLKTLIAHGADVKARTSRGSTPLIYAISLPEMPPIGESLASDELAKVKLLLDKGADINAKYHGGYSPLMRSTIFGNLEIIKLLLDRGADTKAVNDQGQTAHDLALQYHNKEAAKLLEKAGG